MSAEHSFDRVVAAAARLQQLVPDAVLVGGTAAALTAHHRVSFDDDHVLADLAERFDDILGVLEASEGWVTQRVRPGRVILGNLDVAALADRMGLPRAGRVLAGMDDYYEDQRGGGRGVTTQLVRALADPQPYDFDDVDLAAYRKLVDRWRDWATVRATCSDLSAAVLAAVVEPS